MTATEGATLRSANQKQEPSLPHERPILFSSEMVRAILDGRKTQTRRVGDMRGADRVYWHVGETHAWKGKPPQHYEGWVAEVNSLNGLLLPLRCPFGQVGDRLWVRETFKWVGGDSMAVTDQSRILYRADPPWGSDSYEREWSPSIHMPRRYSRITLEVTAVRVERLREISVADAVAEGRRCEHGFDYCTRGCGDPVQRYAHFWNIVNEKRGYSWDSNPWCWVIEFRVASQRGDQK